MATESSNIIPVIQGAIHQDAAKEIGSIAVMTERLKKLKKKVEAPTKSLGAPRTQP